MRNPRHHLQWRTVFLLALLIGTLVSVFARSADRTDLVRWSMVSVWIAVALLYAFLAWKTRASPPEDPGADVLPLVALIVAAIYESNWPGRRPNFTPDTIVFIMSAAYLSASLTDSMRKKAAERT